MYEEMGKYQRYADELQNAADEQEAARVAAVCAVYRRVVQEWAEILEGR
jgi:hypothetical protein